MLQLLALQKEMRDTIKLFMDYKYKNESSKNPHYYIYYQRLVNDTEGLENKIQVCNTISEKMIEYMDSKIKADSIKMLILNDLSLIKASNT